MEGSLWCRATKIGKISLDPDRGWLDEPESPVWNAIDQLLEFLWRR